MYHQSYLKCQGDARLLGDLSCLQKLTHPTPKTDLIKVQQPAVRLPGANPIGRRIQVNWVNIF